MADQAELIKVNEYLKRYQPSLLVLSDLSKSAYKWQNLSKAEYMWKKGINICPDLFIFESFDWTERNGMGWQSTYKKQKQDYTKRTAQS